MFRSRRKTADPRLQMAFDITNQVRKIQLATLAGLRDRSLALLEIIFLGVSIIFAFGSSSRGHLRVWMVILLLVGLVYSLGATLVILLPRTWSTVPEWQILSPAKSPKCSCQAKSIDECIEYFLKDAKAGFAQNDKLLAQKRHMLISEFIVLGVLISMAVIFWGTLGG